MLTLPYHLGTPLGQHRAKGLCTRHLHIDMPRVLGLSLMQCAAPVPPVQWPAGGSGGMIHSAPHFFPTTLTCEAWERACTSSAETTFCPIAAAHCKSNPIGSYYNSGANSSLGQSIGLVNTVTMYFAATLLILQLQFRPKVPMLT